MHPENARSLAEQRRLEIMTAARPASGTGPRPGRAAQRHPRRHRWWVLRRPLLPRPFRPARQTHAR